MTIKQEEDFLKGISVVFPNKKDGRERPPTIPQPILDGKPLKMDRPTMREISFKYGGPGVFIFPKHEHFLLEKDEWKYDEIPQIMDGMNVMDFYDKDIVANLAKLEEEEKILEAQFQQKAENEPEFELGEDFMSALAEVNKISKRKKGLNDLKRNNRKKKKLMNEKKFQRAMKKRGIDSSEVVRKANLRRKKETLQAYRDKFDKNGKRMGMDVEAEGDDNEMDKTGRRPRKLVKRAKSQLRSMSRARSKCSVPHGRDQNKVTHHPPTLTPLETRQNAHQSHEAVETGGQDQLVGQKSGRLQAEAFILRENENEKRL